jgi:hypothetical protein
MASPWGVVSGRGAGEEKENMHLSIQGGVPGKRLWEKDWRLRMQPGFVWRGDLEMTKERIEMDLINERYLKARTIHNG